MKRGFLNTDKAKDKLAAVALDAFLDTDNGEGKGKQNAELPPLSVESFVDLPYLNLHSVPPAIKSTLGHPEKKTRYIFRLWPRDPNGKIIVPSDIHGKEAGNGLQLWGATLYDFYHVNRIPSSIHGITISTGSKLARVMQSFGELEHAQDELTWASREADPKEILAWDPAEAIVAHEQRVLAGFDHENKGKATSSQASSGEDVQMMDVSEVTGHPSKESVQVLPFMDGVDGPTGECTVNDVEMQEPSSGVPVESPFHPSHYPSPWPLAPFESPLSPFALQRGIPIHLLPKKLYVHDPWNLVNADYMSSSTLKKLKKESWSSKSDRVRTYTLSLPPESQKMAEAASKAADIAEEQVFNTPHHVFIPPQNREGPTVMPAIRATLPPRPFKLTEVPEAHLYLSPKGKLGIGNHSVVYEAELELPRELFCESQYCETCLDEHVDAEIDRLMKSGKWQELLYGQDDTSTSSRKLSRYHVGYVRMKVEHEPMQTVEMIPASAFGKAPEGAPPQHHARVSDMVINRSFEYEGPVVPIHVNIPWQNPSYPDTICKHNAEKMKPVPQTATFRVAAKLSLLGDPHLAREADNYLKFPAHFFQHWNGYNVIPPLHDPTPCSALVPQFFGYYVPDPAESDSDGTYASPILLVEHCGEPICANKLSIDDRQECAAFLLRFHEAGWLHESFAERNILVQKRHPMCSPLEDKDKCEHAHKHGRNSFRLIDFGRSRHYSSRSETDREESTARELFNFMFWNVDGTDMAPVGGRR